jgi:4-methyl-5(b-hydroxyethyl)-thiazole monophosphate biosynthesis
MKKALVLLPKGFEFLEVASILDVFTWNEMEGQGDIEWKVAGMGQWVESAGGHKLSTDLNLSDSSNLENFDALIMPGGFESKGYFEDLFSEHFLNTTQFFVDNAKLIATFCVASLIFTKIHFKNISPKLTTYAYGDGKRRMQLQELGFLLSCEKICRDRHFISCDGPGSAPALAIKILEMLTSKDNAIQIGKLTGILDCYYNNK